MKKNKKLTIILSVILAVAVIAGVSAYAASVYGTSSDPLITLSYLNETLTPKLLEQFKAELNSAVDELNAGSSFSVVTLSKDQVLTAALWITAVLSRKTICIWSPSPAAASKPLPTPLRSLSAAAIPWDKLSKQKRMSLGGTA